jgi:hypothetical protein
VEFAGSARDQGSDLVATRAEEVDGVVGRGAELGGAAGIVFENDVLDLAALEKLEGAFDDPRIAALAVDF